jgi:hypothetical protein
LSNKAPALEDELKVHLLSWSRKRRYIQKKGEIFHLPCPLFLKAKK